MTRDCRHATPPADPAVAAHMRSSRMREHHSSRKIHRMDINHDIGGGFFMSIKTTIPVLAQGMRRHPRIWFVWACRMTGRRVPWILQRTDEQYLSEITALNREFNR